MSSDADRFCQELGLDSSEFALPPEAQLELARNAEYTRTMEPLQGYLGRILSGQTVHYYDTGIVEQNAKEPIVRGVIGPYNSMSRTNPDPHHAPWVRAIITWESRDAPASRLIVANDFVIDMLSNAISWRQQHFKLVDIMSKGMIWLTTRTDVPKVIRLTRGGKDVEPAQALVCLGSHYEETPPPFDSGTKVEVASRLRDYLIKFEPVTEVLTGSPSFVVHKNRN